MREGSLDAPVRHPIDWQNPDFTDPAKLEAEMRRVFEACHGCRLCFNLCDSFPRLFDLVDAAGDAELAGVKTADFKRVVDACTLCDLCFMTKCPYVPPHEWAIDFPHLMLRARATEAKTKGIGRWDRALAETDRNGKLGCNFAGLANWATDVKNRPARALMEKVAGVHREAALPKFNVETFVKAARYDIPRVNETAPAFGRKAAIYATCFGNYNAPAIGAALRRVLAHNGVATEVVYPGCCGMPQLEQGEIARVAESARAVARELRPWIDAGHDIVALVPSCALMMKFEWPLIVPDDENVKALARATRDAAEYIVAIAKKEGLAPGLGALDGGVTLHIACHARAQNVGHKAAELLRLIPGIDLKVIERCSGHGGSWGVKKENFEVALKIGKPVAREAVRAGKTYVASECPLAGLHILQGMERIEGAGPPPEAAPHPVELFAKAYGLA